MPPLALVLALSAAFLHAGWNLLLARSPDTNARTAVALAVGAVVFAPLAVGIGRVEGQALPYVAASGGCELLYFLFLARAYGQAEMSVVYPVARGLGPVLVLAVSVTVLAASWSPPQVLGVLLVASGIVLVRGLRGRTGPRELGLAVAVAGCIAAYTLIDKAGLRWADPLPYFWLVNLVTAIGFGGVLVIRGGGARMRGEFGAGSAAAGVAMFSAYTLVLAALTLAPAASVAAARETSVVVAMVLAVRFLHEPVERSRYGGALLVVAGIAALALG